MAATYTLKIEADVAEVLARATIVGRSVTLPPGQLDRKLYERVDKVLKAAGGKWNRSAKAHVFDSDAGIDAFTSALGKGSITDEKKLLQQFFTPDDVAMTVIQRAAIREGVTVLEPSAGKGALAIRARRAGGIVTCVEIDKFLCSDLEHVHGFEVHCADFMEFTPELRFDRVVMNPPFAGKQDIDHVIRAFDFLRPGGILAAIMGAGVKSNEWKEARAFRQLVAAHDGAIEDLPDGAFAESGTMVRTVVVTMEKS